jgi:hypothetical protein
MHDLDSRGHCLAKQRRRLARAMTRRRFFSETLDFRQ